MNKYEVYLGDLTCEKIKCSDETVKYGVKTNIIFLNNFELKEIQESMMKTLYWYLVDKNDLEYLEQELQRKDNIINDLKSSIADYQEAVGDYQDEIVRKDNIINEIKEYVDDELAEYEDNEDYEIDFYNMECLQDKIQTLIFEYDERVRNGN